MANYSRERSKFGGYVGSIQIHTSAGLGSDPTSAVFNNILPAGFLKCDGSILEARDYLALSQVLGVGEQSRYGKEGALLRDADLTINDFGTIQLPDLGSKVIIPSRGSGDYLADIVDSTTQNRVGPQIQVESNVGPVIEVSYIGNFRGLAQTNIDMNSNPSYSMPRNTEPTSLDINNFQGHAHNSNFTALNFTTNHRTVALGSTGAGKDGASESGNGEAEMYLDFTQVNTSTDTPHQHRISKPLSYVHNFRYSFNNFDIPADQMKSQVEIDLSKDTKLDSAVAPFILVEYIIKY